MRMKKTIIVNKKNMKNQKERELLNYLSRECEINKFTVVEKRDILYSLEKEIKDEEELDYLLLSLERQMKVKIKYEDDNVYCLSLLKKEIEVETEKREGRSPLFSNLLINLLASFLGSLLGSLIINLIFKIV